MGICLEHLRITTPYNYYYSSTKQGNYKYKKFLTTTKSNNPIISISISTTTFKSLYSSTPLSNNSLHFNLPLPNNNTNTNTNTNTTNESDASFVEVIGIGSRIEALFQFCLLSPFIPHSLRFWNLIVEDSTKMQLHQFTGKDGSPTVMEISPGRELCSKTFILVATAAYASDQIRVLDILNRVKSANGVAVGIIVKPFSFEGRRRQVEVHDLLEKLQEHTNFCIGIDTDVLLEKDIVTLDEALKTANTAVLMAINAVSVLVSESKKKLLNSVQDNIKELKVSESLEILEGYKQGEVGFGAGYNIKTSTMQAIYDCPFLSAGLKDLERIVIAILTSSDVIERSEIKVFLRTLRQNTDFKGKIILSLVHEPDLEPNLITTTVVTIRHQASQGNSIFSQLSQRLPFIFNLLKRQPTKSRNTEGIFSENPTVSEVDLPDSFEMPDMIPTDGEVEGFGSFSAEIQTLLSSNDDGMYNLSIPATKEIRFSEPTPDLSNFYDPNVKGATSYVRKPLIQKFESGFDGQDDWGNDSEEPSLLDKLSIFQLPIGVKLSAELKSSRYNYENGDQKKDIDENIKSQQIQITPRSSANTSPIAGFEAVSELFDTGSPATKRTYDVSGREGVLSARAASMLEAERNSQKKWNPIIEMRYRGGLYKGRCQGGLPEGKGRLSLSDGSMYDGMWRSGKRSGLGTYYFSNGDFYRGSWRDDVMHGKGWLYFKTGDRWFVNFWKGKANGEGRFYSKIGKIFFGHFKDGWRHGHFLCISVEGDRYFENWDEGVLVSKKQLDADDVGT